jgi:flagellar operon protein
VSGPIFYPNVSRIPAQPAISESKKPSSADGVLKGEFDASLENAIQRANLQEGAAVKQESKLDQAALGIKFSAHATQRLRERQISFDPETLSRMNDAISKADSKGVQDTLMLTDKAALIVNVPNRTVITAMDRNNLSGNVFTNIDGAVII